MGRLGNLKERVHGAKPGQNGDEHRFMRGTMTGGIT
jgi:hypothetical protein